MEITSKEIQVGEGLEQLKFGTSREDVQKFLGEPDEIETYSDEETDEEINEAWHYDDLELSLSFDKEENWRLSTISVSNDAFTVYGNTIIGLLKEDLIKLIEDKGMGAYESEQWSTEEDDETQDLVSIADKSINFWFTEGKVTEIQWGPFYDSQEQTIWPN